MTARVPAAVLAAFGLPCDGQPLSGGEGRSFRHGPAVLKPVDDQIEAAWSAELLARIERSGFRLPQPLRSRDGRYVVDGWSAYEYLAGETGPAARWQELLSAGRAFHAALAGAPRPGFLDDRTHRWAVADRVAWGEATVDVPTQAAELYGRLGRLLRPVGGSPQLIHGDLTGNVLFAGAAPPAIIDFSPYWRPAGYADAIVVADGLLWHGALTALLAQPVEEFRQLLVRAVIFRLVALTESGDLAELPLFRPVVELVERFVTAR